MNSALWKDNFREIKNSLPRFLSILAIITLGVSFFVGVRTSGPTMLATAQKVYELNNMPDGYVISTFGLVEEDIEALEKLEGIKWLPMQSIKANLKTNGESLKIYTSNGDSKDNFFEMVQGRMIEKANEIVLDSIFIETLNQNLAKPIEIGDQVVLEYSNPDTDQGIFLDNYKFEVVGFARSPLYMEKARRGNDYNAFAVISDQCLRGNLYSEAYYWVNEAEDKLAYSQEYVQIIEEALPQIERVVAARKNLRLAEVKEELKEQVVQGKDQLLDGYQSLYSGQMALYDGEKTINEANEEIESNKLSLGQAFGDLGEGYHSFKDGIMNYHEGRLSLLDGRQKLRDGHYMYEQGLVDYQEGQVIFEEEIANAQSRLSQAQAEVNQGYLSAEEGHQELLTGQVALEEGYAQLNQGRQDLLNQIDLANIGEIAPEDFLASLTDQITLLNDLVFLLETSENDQANLASEITNLLFEREVLVSNREELIQSIQGLENESDNFPLSSLIAEEEIYHLGNLLNQELAFDIPVNDVLNMLKTRLDELTHSQISLTDEDQVQGNIIEDLKLSQEEIQTSLEELISENNLLNTILQSSNETVTSTQEASESSLQENLDLQDIINTINLNQEQIDILNNELARIEELLQTRDEESVSQKSTSTRETIVQLTNAITQLENAKEDLAFQSQRLSTGWQKYYEGLAQLESAQLEINRGWDELISQRDSGQNALDNALVELNKGQNELESSLSELNQGIEKLIFGLQEINRGYLDYSRGLEEAINGHRKILEGENESLTGQLLLHENFKEFEKNYGPSINELALGQKELRQGMDILENLQAPVYYVSQRDDISSYKSIENNAQQLEAISNIFPVFFIIVAILVTYTTIKRMVSEQRNYIGTMKQMGYQNSLILYKFVLYAGLAGLLGTGFGIFLGYLIFPEVIVNAYGIMYYFDDMVLRVSKFWNIVSIVVAMLTVLVPAILTPLLIMRAPAAELLQAEPPKSGKKTIFERMEWLWNQLSFFQKLTIRNIMRYKGRNSMTIIGVAGCTMLMLTGFGISNTINALASTQFKEIQRFDSIALLNDSVDEKGWLNLREDFMDIDGIESVLPVYQEIIEVKTEGGDSHQATLFVPIGSKEEVSQFIQINLREQDPIDLTQSGPVITERLAELLNKDQGSFEIMTEDYQTFQVKFDYVVENYAQHYLYLSPDDYRALFNKSILANSALLNYHDDAVRNEIDHYLTNNSKILSLLDIKLLAGNVEDAMGSLDIITIVLIIAAAALSFIVLYNLTNINVSERIRELSTIKVLGFYDFEVSRYIFNEVLILTLIGSLLGLGFGSILTRYIMKTMQTNELLFYPTIHLKSYFISFALSFLFSSIVMVAMHMKLKKVDMVEALKAVD